MKFSRRKKIIALVGGVVVAGGLAATIVAGGNGPLGARGGSGGGGNISTSNSSYQTGVAYAESNGSLYIPGYNMSGADATPVYETPSLFCAFDGSTAWNLGGNGEVADAPPGPFPEFPTLPASGTPTGEWLAGCTVTITATYGS